jgi:SAM-dependent methyltransferase
MSATDDPDDIAARLRKGPRLDPAGPHFWDARYGERFTPWDQGGVPARLASFIAGEPAPLGVLIPGCGAGYEVAAFADAGHDVLAIDFSDAAIARARAVLGTHAGRVRHADFFAFDIGRPFELVYERAFLCALPRSLWERWARRIAEVVAPGGRLAGFFFRSDERRGPPFGLAAGELEGMLAGRFERVEEVPVTDSIPVFAGRERWEVWRRK